MALLLAIGLVVLWIQAPGLYGRGDAAKTAAATTRGAILTVTAALIAAAAAGAGVLIARTLAKTRRANRQADQRNRYAKAIKQLGSSHLDVQLSGTYTLERIAKTSERDQRTVVEVLRAFISKHRRLPPSRGHPRRSRTTVRTATDVQAAIDVLLRLPTHPGLPQVQLDHATSPTPGSTGRTCPVPISPGQPCPMPGLSGQPCPMPTSPGQPCPVPISPGRT